MLYLASKKAVFFHIPKTGGSSLTAIVHPYVELAQKQLPDLKLVATNWRGYAKGWQGTHHLEGNQHSGYAESEAEFAGILSDSWKFAFVRNPWDRVASIWRSRLKCREPFAQTVRTELPLDPMIGRTQKSYLIGTDGLLKMDFIGRYKRFAADVRRILSRLGITAPEIPHLLPSASDKHYSTYFDTKTRDFVAELFKEDIEEFGCQFESVSSA
jgi:hypothetical protein